jgi:hypothetical protein
MINHNADARRRPGDGRDAPEAIDDPATNRIAT